MKAPPLTLLEPVSWPTISVLSPVEAEPLLLTDWIERIRRAWSCNAGHTLELAQLTSRARQSLPYGSWSRLWQSGALPFSKRKGEKLVVIGETLGGMDANNCSQLPVAWNTLYYLARLGRVEAERLIQQGRIHAGLTLREAKTLLAELHPEWRRTTPHSKLKSRVKHFVAWLRAERENWSLPEREFVHRQLLSLAGEIRTPVGAAPARATAPVSDEPLNFPTRSHSIPML